MKWCLSPVNWHSQIAVADVLKVSCFHTYFRISSFLAACEDQDIQCSYHFHPQQLYPILFEHLARGECFSYQSQI